MIKYSYSDPADGGPLREYADLGFTPVENHEGLWIKREDLYRYPNGANGSKLRAAEQLLKSAYDKGYRKVVTAAACVSPQHALVSSAAKNLGMTSHHIVGGTKPTTLHWHSSVRIAIQNGATFQIEKVGYNPALVKAARSYAEAHPDTYWLHYGISAAPDASVLDLFDFHKPSAYQTLNIPSEVTRVVLPFGSGNTGAGVLAGLIQQGWAGTVQLMGIGPDRTEWLRNRLTVMGWWQKKHFAIDYTPLHPGFATYGDRMPETLDGIELHPTYEGKVARFLNLISPDWWVHPDDHTMLWIVGSAIPRLPGSSS